MVRATKLGAPWTADDAEQLHKLAHDGMNAAAIAERMDRTRLGIVKKVVAERLSLDPTKRQS